MLNYTFSLVDFEILILILVRISCFVYAAPFFGMKNVPSRVKIGLSLADIEKDRISDYMAAFYSISFFLKSQGVIQEIYYGEHKYLLCHIEQYEELFTDIFCGEYELSSDPMGHLYKIPLCEKGQDLQKFLYDMEL